jgi:hypothetical protein
MALTMDSFLPFGHAFSGFLPLYSCAASLPSCHQGHPGQSDWRVAWEKNQRHTEASLLIDQRIRDLQSVTLKDLSKTFSSYTWRKTRLY